MEDNPTVKLSVNQLFSSFCGLLVLVIGCYIEIKISSSNQNERITNNEKKIDKQEDYKAKIDFKLDKIIETITQIKIDNANQRVLDAEKKIEQ
ncbi:hypothetical protein [Flavobacterium algicola]|uniref:hypothetical protein n=1 Tax=Flavobacterium algicola TaxID=556529 RepID=UPI001EFEE62A|nr:hypothetical protein [Flavobacterium algicola]MCG9792471.1 hypothetical protein [Flavobacterium algicola]